MKMKYAQCKNDDPIFHNVHAPYHSVNSQNMCWNNHEQVKTLMCNLHDRLWCWIVNYWNIFVQVQLDHENEQPWNIYVNHTATNTRCSQFIDIVPNLPELPDIVPNLPEVPGECEVNMLKMLWDIKEFCQFSDDMRHNSEKFIKILIMVYPKFIRKL